MRKSKTQFMIASALTVMVGMSTAAEPIWEVDGNFGVGTDAPKSKLHINGSTGLKIFNTNNVLGQHTGITFGSTYKDFSRAWVGAVNTNTSTAAGSLVFKTNLGSNLREVGRFNHRGYLGIGTTAPLKKLHIQHKNGEFGVYSDITNGTSPYPGSRYMVLNAVNSHPEGTNAGLAYRFKETDNGISYSFGIEAVVKNRAASYVESDLAFSSRTSSGLTEKMRLTGQGNLSLGAVNPLFSEGSGLEIQRKNTMATIRLESIKTGASALELKAGNGKSVIDSRGSAVPLIFKVAAKEKMRITPDGSVGMGTDTPSTNLQVYSPKGGDKSGVSIGSDQGSLNIWGGTVSGLVLDVTEGGVNSRKPAVFQLMQGRKNSLVIDKEGRTVLGDLHISKAPSYGKFVVQQSQNDIDGGLSVVGTDTHSLRLYVTDDKMRHIAAGQTPVMSFNDKGLVGIGTVAPEASLDVQGSNNSTDLFRATPHGKTRGFRITSGGTVSIQPNKNRFSQAILAFHPTHLSPDNRYYTGLFDKNSSGAMTLRGSRDLFVDYGSGSDHDKLIIRRRSWNHEQRKNVFEAMLAMDSEGRMSLGTASANPDYLMTVNGKIIAKGFTHKTDIWADYVFEPDYRLRPLSEVESFIKKNKHLPEIPSEKEIMANGNDMSKTQVLLLQKIEELTLYTIQQQKEIDALKAQVAK